MVRFGRSLEILVLTAAAVFVFFARSEAMMGSGMMPMPTGKEMFFYGAITTPVTGSDASSTMPIGVGSVATGGDMATVHVSIGQFAGPVDMYFMVYAPAKDPFNIYMVHEDGSILPVSMGFAPWMQGVTGADQDVIGSMPVSTLPKGTYDLDLVVTPSGSNMSSYYMWTTTVTLK